MLAPSVVLRGQVVGTWRRTLVRAGVAIAIDPFERLTAADRDAISAAAGRYAAFLQLKPAVEFG